MIPESNSFATDIGIFLQTIMILLRTSINFKCKFDRYFEQNLRCFIKNDGCP